MSDAWLPLPTEKPIGLGLTFGKNAADQYKPGFMLLVNPGVEMLHARIEKSGAQYRVRNLSPAANTWVNEEPVKDTGVLLSGGDLLRIGPFRAVFSESDAFLLPARRVAGVCVQFRDVQVETVSGNKLLLHDVTFSAKPGQVTAIVGPSGAGKSTLVKTILLHPSVRHTGEFLAGGLPAKDLPHFRSWLGYVSQEKVLHADLNAYRIVSFSARLRPWGNPQSVRKILREVDLPEASWTTSVSSLSGGEDKRVRTAAELVAEPRLLILDEPASGLDRGREQRMMRLLRQLSLRGSTVIVVTHNWRHLDDFDQVIVVNQQTVVFAGSPRELRAQIPDANWDSFDPALLKSQSSLPVVPATNQAPTSLAVSTKRATRFRASAKTVFWLVMRELSVLLATSTRSTIKRGGGGMWAGNRSVVKKSTRRGLLSRLSAGFAQLALARGHVFQQATREFVAAPIFRRFLVPVLLVPGCFAAAIGSAVPKDELPLLGFFAVLACIWMGASLSLMAIVDERKILDHERLLFLSIPQYLVAKVVVLWGLALLQTIIFESSLAIFRTRIIDAKMLYEPYWLLLYLVVVSWAAVGCGLFISAGANRSKPLANFVLPLFMLVQIVFSVHVAGEKPKGQLQEAYRHLHFHHCGDADCKNKATGWTPQLGWRCAGHAAKKKPTSGRNQDEPTSEGWISSLASYLTLSRYGDVMLRTFAYLQQDADDFRQPPPKDEQTSTSVTSSVKYGYAQWRFEALGVLVVIAICAPALAGLVIHAQESG